MAEPMKIRATLQGDVADVRILMLHPMETGARKDAKGDIVPRHFIQNVAVTHNGKTVLDAQWSQAVSRNPFLGLRVKGAKAGDKVSVTWVDNKGDKRTDEATVSARDRAAPAGYKNEEKACTATRAMARCRATVGFALTWGRRCPREAGRPPGSRPPDAGGGQPRRTVDRAGKTLFYQRRGLGTRRWSSATSGRPGKLEAPPPGCRATSPIPTAYRTWSHGC
jgi:sulfur-oxidizing protein SoxZ